MRGRQLVSDCVELFEFGKVKELFIDELEEHITSSKLTFLTILIPSNSISIDDWNIIPKNDQRDCDPLPSDYPLLDSRHGKNANKCAMTNIASSCDLAIPSGTQALLEPKL